MSCKFHEDGSLAQLVFKFTIASARARAQAKIFSYLFPHRLSVQKVQMS